MTLRPPPAPLPTVPSTTAGRRARTAGLALAVASMAVVGCGSGDGSLDPAGGAAGDGAGEVAADTPTGVAEDAVGSAGGDVLTVDTVPVPVRPEVVIPAGWASEIEAVYGRYWLYWEAFAAAHGPPGADPTFEPLKRLSTPTNWDSLRRQLEAFADDGLVLARPEPSITEHLIRLPGAAVLTGDEGEEVVLQDCWIDDFRQQTVDGTVVAEAREAKLMNVVMRVVDGEWRVDGVTRASSDSDGVEQCAELIN